MRSLRSIQGSNSPAHQTPIKTRTIKGPINNEEELILYNYIMDYKYNMGLDDIALPNYRSAIYSFIKSRDANILFSIDTLNRLLTSIANTAKIVS